MRQRVWFSVITAVVIQVLSIGCGVASPPPVSLASGTVLDAVATPASGIWWRTDGKSQVEQYADTWFLSGGRATWFTWCEIEESPGVYDFSLIDDFIDTWAAVGKKAIVGINPGGPSTDRACPVDPRNPDIVATAPGWLFGPGFNVPYVDAPQKDYFQDVPPTEKRHYWAYFWNETFKARHISLLEAFASHLVESGRRDSVAWVVALAGRGNGTGLTGGYLYGAFVDAFVNDLSVAADYNSDGRIGIRDLELFWTEHLKGSIDAVHGVFAPAGLKNELVVNDFKPKGPQPRYFEPFLREVVAHAAAKGFGLTSASLDTDPEILLYKSAPHILADYPGGSLGNDWSTARTDASVDPENFRRNYENAIGGVRGIPNTRIAYAYMAPGNELQLTTARYPKGCRDLDLKTDDLCYPELEDTVLWLLERLEENAMAKVVLLPTADTFNMESSPGRSFGDARVLKISKQEGKRKHAYLQFNAAGVGVDQVASAVLRVYAGRGSATCEAMAVSNDDWSEALSWEDSPSFVGILDSAECTAGSSTEFDVTDYVNAELSGDQVISIGLSSSAIVKLASSESYSNAPELVLIPYKD